MKKETRELKYFATRVMGYRAVIHVNIEAPTASEAVEKLLRIYDVHFKDDDTKLYKSVKELSKKPENYE
jgi:hypothetical protein